MATKFFDISNFYSFFKRHFCWHDWENDCTTCRVCGKKREVEHQWSGCKCKCVKCSQTRDQEHIWSGCKCRTCGEIRDEKHDWSKNCEKCAVCGKTRNRCHKWMNGVCDYCKISMETIFIEECMSAISAAHCDILRMGQHPTRDGQDMKYRIMGSLIKKNLIPIVKKFGYPALTAEYISCSMFGGKWSFNDFDSQIKFLKNLYRKTPS